MVDLNHIFLFLALVSPVAVVARGWRSDSGQRSWRIAAGVVLAVTGVSWVLIRDQAGYIGAGAWFALLFLPAIGLKKMTELATLGNYRSARRLASALQWLHPSAELRDEIRALRTLEIRQQAGELPASAFHRGRRFRTEPRGVRGAPAVTLLIVINVLVFGVELLFLGRGYNEGEVLFRLGALEPILVLFGHEYWRLIAALFLHAGWVHLLFNLFALYVLGPPFERAIGSIRFTVCYLIAGICSTAGVLLLWRLHLVHDADVVGASGCVMGIVGAWAAFLLRDHHSPEVRQRLLNIVMIVVIQTVFDLSTPQVSMSAHLCGLVGGFLIGLVVAPGPAARRPATPRSQQWAGGVEAD
ncbi:MAG: rhomboid family intramembrane serine protease [Chthoniobacterales bacterium]